MNKCNLPTFATSLSATYEKKKEIPIAKIEKLLESGKPLFEWLDSTQIYKPYFDIDKYIEGNLNKAEMEVETMKYVILGKNAITSMFTNKFQIDLDFINDFAIETNSRIVKEKVKGVKYNCKISIHIIIPKYKILGTQLKEVLIDTHNTETHDGLFDAGVYGKNKQKFRVAGFRKATKDEKPILHGDRDYSDYLISRVDESNILIPNTKCIIVPNDYEKNKHEVSKLYDKIGTVDDYDTWLKISIATKNIDDRLKTVWDEWSKKSSNYDKDVNDQKWNSFKKGSSGLGTLIYYANQNIYPNSMSSDKPANSEPNPLLDTFMEDGTQLAASNLFCSVYGKYIKCVDQAKEMFMLYDHKKCIWVSKTVKNIYNEVSNIIQDELNVKLNEYTFKIETNISCSQKEVIDEKINKIIALKKTLSGSTYISGVNKFVSCNSSIFDDDFRTKTTQKTDILSVKNGIVELRTGKLRPRCYDDYQVSFIDMNYKEEVEYSEWSEFLYDLFDHPNIKEIDNMLNYIHKLFGYLITKETSAQVMTICNGSGGNGKSVVTNIMQKIFENNVAKVDESLIDKSQKSNANSASPEIAKLYNKTTAFIEETEDDTELGKVFKQLVDGGKSQARELYGNPFVFENTAKIVMNTNNLPSFKSSAAFLRRIIIIQYFNSYVYESDRKSPTDKIRDDNKESNLLKNKEGILKWFVEGSMRFYKEGKLCDIPHEMRIAKNDLQQANDWTSTLNFTGNDSDRMTCVELNEHIDIQCTIKVNSRDMKKILESRGATACKFNGSRGYKGVVSTILSKEEYIEVEEEYDPLNG